MLGNRSKRVWWLVDCNSFFASCEVLKNPTLKGKCVCVGGDIIVAATYEAKAYGVGTGTPVREAKKLLPSDAVFLSTDFTWYKEVSKRLMNLLASLSHKIEVFSIDEAFIDITDREEKYSLDYTTLAKKLQQKILQDIGIPTSIGFAPTRILAKIFAEINKPLGTHVSLDQPSIIETLASRSLGNIPFVGRKWLEHREYFCTTAKDFAWLDYSLVKQKMGRSGLKIRGELNSYNMFHFDRKKKPKSILRTRSFNPHFTTDPAIIWTYLVKHIFNACEQLHYHQLKVKSIKLVMRDKSFARFGPERTLPFATDDKETILTIAQELFQKLPFWSIRYRTAGVHFGELQDGRHHQQSLFTNQQHKTTDPLEVILHQVRKKCWDTSVKRTSRSEKKKKVRFE